ncbi:MAG: lytic murein transglycosylase [Alphaproteobacteria bacterium]|nr:lytic murein transglycosylase [Alphaproteobacteria bacterium]
MKREINIYQRCVGLLSVSLFFIISIVSNDIYGSKESFEKFIEVKKTEAISRGYDKPFVDKIFDEVKYSDNVISLSERQAEFTKSVSSYLSDMVSLKRAKEGRLFRREHIQTFDKYEEKYKVEASVLSALIGLETNYGSYTGVHNLMDSMLSLSYMKKRASFFDGQMWSLVSLGYENKIDISKLKGSWAGASGYVQFIPSNISDFGVDGNSDGKVDIWSSWPDAIASGKNFLKNRGYKYGEDIVYFISSTDIDINTKEKVSWWAKRVLVWDYQKEGYTNNWRITSKSRQAEAVLDKLCKYKNEWRVCNEKYGVIEDTQYYLKLPNYFVLRRWNNSTSYVLAVAKLSKMINMSIPRNPYPL